MHDPFTGPDPLLRWLTDCCFLIHEGEAPRPAQFTSSAELMGWSKDLDLDILFVL